MSASRACSGGPQPHEHGHKHARALFRRSLRGRGGGRVRGHLRAARAGRLHRDGAQDLGPGRRVRRHRRRDLAVPRAATAREADAVLRADRRNDLLSRFVAAARARRGARRGRLGLAIHLASTCQRDRARNLRDHRLQSDIGQSARALEADGSRAVRLGAGRRHPGRVRLLVESDQRRGSGDHQRGTQRAAGRPADRPHRVSIRYGAAVQGTNRSARSGARRRSLGVQGSAPIHPRQGSGGSGHLLPDHDPHPGTGAQQFLHPRNCVLLATADLHPFVGEFRVRDGRLSIAVSQAHRTAVFAGCDGDVGGFCEPSLLPDGRRAEDGFEWRGRRLSALRAFESN